MRATSNATIQYNPGLPPADPAQLGRFLQEEFIKIQAAIAALAAGHLDKSTTAPAKPRDGDIRYADGTNFKPNGTGGAGIYYFNGSAWILLG